MIKPLLINAAKGGEPCTSKGSAAMYEIKFMDQNCRKPSFQYAYIDQLFREFFEAFEFHLSKLRPDLIKGDSCLDDSVM